MAFQGDLLVQVKKLLRFTDDYYDDELAIQLPAAIQKLVKEGVPTPSETAGNEMYVVCCSFEVAKLIESSGIPDSRMNQLKEMYFEYIILLKEM